MLRSGIFMALEVLGFHQYNLLGRHCCFGSVDERQMWVYFHELFEFVSSQNDKPLAMSSYLNHLSWKLKSIL